MPGPDIGSPGRKYPPIQFGIDGDETSAIFKDYEAVGKKLVEWAQQGEDSWPKTIDELRVAFKDLLTIPDVFKRLRVEQGDDGTEGDYELVLRLPPKGQVTESEQIVKAKVDEDVYPLPALYTEFEPGGRDEDKKVITQLRFFYARVADYTMRGCR
ncbi:MAG: hypothetical protein E5X53_01930 [Mesorhizobium sp.]|uniref:hypothetical protein n=1 Tax=Mesorhizobium sp. TaxID=1871066 RepID=UPI00121776BB|nr:hypothetical protein [Mesorhizobium sp.]TIP75577.1 MAG: hypothetical protein E5X55_02855 [Mesorhizobium sp.]TIQ11954.1 MAG: hypothetical protein E5X57_15665 [Mesorhizobium sp.]TIR54602.1 MAG: hypothetical protein E5X53_01930 [Mesorhizobium sp.]TJV99639.1 MAG: hypothetical protein E5X52_02970 [Mesorhizobium sp.]